MARAPDLGPRAGVANPIKLMEWGSFFFFYRLPMKLGPARFGGRGIQPGPGVTRPGENSEAADDDDDETTRDNPLLARGANQRGGHVLSAAYQALTGASAINLATYSRTAANGARLSTETWSTPPDVKRFRTGTRAQSAIVGASPTR